jgi:hypothetical protein
VRQGAIAQWPTGLCFALAVIDDAAVARLGLHFEAYEEDGLGLHFAALVQTEAGFFALRRGVASPSEGTQVWCMADGAQTAERIAAFSGAFGIAESELVWRTPFEVAQANPPAA